MKNILNNTIIILTLTVNGCGNTGSTKLMYGQTGQNTSRQASHNFQQPPLNPHSYQNPQQQPLNNPNQNSQQPQQNYQNPHKNSQQPQPNYQNFQSMPQFNQNQNPQQPPVNNQQQQPQMPQFNQGQYPQYPQGHFMLISINLKKL